MSTALIGLAIEIGAPFVRRILSDRFGPENTQLAEQVVGAVADRLGVDPDGVDDYAQRHPDEAQAAIQEVERMAPEFMQVLVAETKTREALLLAEIAKGGWQSSWRPAWMVLLGFLWLWNLVLLHILNAIFKIALPMTELSVLLQLTVAFIGIYMGGHTAKSIFKTMKGGA